MSTLLQCGPPPKQGERWVQGLCERGRCGFNVAPRRSRGREPTPEGQAWRGFVALFASATSPWGLEGWFGVAKVCSWDSSSLCISKSYGFCERPLGFARHQGACKRLLLLFALTQLFYLSTSYPRHTYTPSLLSLPTPLTPSPVEVSMWGTP